MFQVSSLKTNEYCQVLGTSLGVLRLAFCIAIIVFGFLFVLFLIKSSKQLHTSTRMPFRTMQQQQYLKHVEAVVCMAQISEGTVTQLINISCSIAREKDCNGRLKIDQHSTVLWGFGFWSLQYTKETVAMKLTYLFQH